MTGLGYLSNDGLILSRLRARRAAQGVELVELPLEPRESARSLEVEEESRLDKFALLLDMLAVTERPIIPFISQAIHPLLLATSPSHR